MIFTRAFALATLERAVRTTAQSAAALITGAGVGLLDVDWVQIASVSGLAGVASVLTSVGLAKVGPPGPSVGPEHVDA